MTVQPRSFYEWAHVDPQRIAFIDDVTGAVNAAELQRRVNRVSHGLRARGLGVGDAVAAVVKNGVDFFVLALATGQVGMYLVPVNWHLAGPELAYIIGDSGAKVVVVDDDEQIAKLDGATLPEHRFALHSAKAGWSALVDLQDGQPDTDPAERTLGDLMGYTSGTTGRPKGVRRHLRSLSPEEGLAPTLRFAQLVDVRPGDGVHLVCSPLYHSAPSAFSLSSLHAGHTVVCHAAFDAEKVLSAIAEHGVTDTHMVPTHFHRLLQLPDDVRHRYDVSIMQSLTHAGASCPVPTKRSIIDWFGPVVWEYLGSTEGGVAMISSQEWLTHPGSVGRPMPWVNLRLLDDDGIEVALGQPGTIYFSTGSASFEYHNDPERTAQTRVGALATVGDIGQLDDDGYLYVLDRRVDLIVSGGVNIYPAEIENQLVTHPAVQDVVVFGVPDDEWGSSAVAVVELADAAAAGDELAEELTRHCLSGLASFKKPQRIEFGSLPRTPTGKISRRTVRDQYLSAHLEPKKPSAGTPDYVSAAAKETLS